MNNFIKAILALFMASLCNVSMAQYHSAADQKGMDMVGAFIMSQGTPTLTQKAKAVYKSLVEECKEDASQGKSCDIDLSGTPEDAFVTSMIDGDVRLCLRNLGGRYLQECKNNAENGPGFPLLLVK